MAKKKAPAKRPVQAKRLAEQQSMLTWTPYLSDGGFICTFGDVGDISPVYVTAQKGYDGTWFTTIYNSPPQDGGCQTCDVPSSFPDVAAARPMEWVGALTPDELWALWVERS